MRLRVVTRAKCQVLITSQGNVPVRNPLALLDLQHLHLGLELIVRQLIQINLVALVIQIRVVVREQRCGKMNTLALRIRFSGLVDRIVVCLIWDWPFSTSAQRRKISDGVRVRREGMFRSGMRWLKDVRRVR
jgi:hypothetical protein